MPILDPRAHLLDDIPLGTTIAIHGQTGAGRTLVATLLAAEQAELGRTIAVHTMPMMLTPQGKHMEYQQLDHVGVTTYDPTPEIDVVIYDRANPALLNAPLSISDDETATPSAHQDPVTADRRAGRTVIVIGAHPEFADLADINIVIGTNITRRLYETCFGHRSPRNQALTLPRGVLLAARKGDEPVLIPFSTDGDFSPANEGGADER